LMSFPILINVVKHVPKRFLITRGPHPKPYQLFHKIYLLSNASQRLGLVQIPLYHTQPLFTTGDTALEPFIHGIGQVDRLSAEMNPG